MNDSIFRLIKLPDLVTLVNALLGFTAILMVVQDNSNTSNASILIVMAVITDGIDGAIARRLEYGLLGEQLDSLADMISFGVAPAVIAYSLLATQYHYLICIVGGTFLACGILRLARFNAINYKSGFRGLPITTSGLAVTLYILTFEGLNFKLFSYGLLGLMVLLGGLMVSRVPYTKIKDFRVMYSTLFLLLLLIVFFYLGDLEKTHAIAGITCILIGLYIFSPVMKLKEIIRK
ncbi:MAG: CDP-diacylglycerol--serine O-phosphatidyltransferase [Methanosarcinales archaeon]|nr:CDP-diacylglycerol--serine O-phosphatidyltransferase [Methanosarcinales archaeon]